MKRGRIKRGPKESDKELAAEYGLKLKYWRYKGRKGIYWSLFSEYVRKRDFYKYGTCVSCGLKFSKWTQAQAGHYAPAQNCGFDLLFDPMNVHAECAGCNNPLFSPGKLITYRKRLVERYGEQEVNKLDDRYEHKQIVKEWSQLEYDSEILKLQDKIKELDGDKDTSKKQRGNIKQSKKRNKADNGAGSTDTESSGG
jgi:hypothetical protein